MRNSIIAIFFAALAGNAMAEWTELGTSLNGTHYVDKGTIRRSGNTVRMWSLDDYSEPQLLEDGRSYMSDAALHEYDCAEKKSRLLQQSVFERKMRGGKSLISNNNPFPWEYTLPGSIGEVRLGIACKGTKK